MLVFSCWSVTSILLSKIKREHLDVQLQWWGRKSSQLIHKESLWTNYVIKLMNWPRPGKRSLPNLVTSSSVASPSECCVFTLRLLIGKTRCGAQCFWLCWVPGYITHKRCCDVRSPMLGLISMCGGHGHRQENQIWVAEIQMTSRRQQRDSVLACGCHLVVVPKLCITTRVGL